MVNAIKFIVFFNKIKLTFIKHCLDKSIIISNIIKNKIFKFNLKIIFLNDLNILFYNNLIYI